VREGKNILSFSRKCLGHNRVPVEVKSYRHRAAAYFAIVVPLGGSLLRGGAGQGEALETARAGYSAGGKGNQCVYSPGYVSVDSEAVGVGFICNK
jgi:hypothetical protein